MHGYFWLTVYYYPQRCDIYVTPQFLNQWIKEYNCQTRLRKQWTSNMCTSSIVPGTSTIWITLSFTSKPLFTCYTIFTPHSCSRKNIPLTRCHMFHMSVCKIVYIEHYFDMNVQELSNKCMTTCSTGASCRVNLCMTEEFYNKHILSGTVGCSLCRQIL